MPGEQSAMKRESVSRLMPVKPFFGSTEQQFSGLHSEQSESYLDHDHQYYYSKSYETRLNIENQPIHESCFFRSYLETDKLENY